MLGYNPESFSCPTRVLPPSTPIPAMSEILKLRGAPALSSSRLARLTDSVKTVLPRLKGLAVEHW